MANYDLGILRSRPISRNNFNVNFRQPTDVFEFDITGSRRLGLYLHDVTGGNADLRLYRDTNRNGVLDSRDRLVAVSRTPGGDTIDFSATRGTYFAQVNRSFGSRVL